MTFFYDGQIRRYIVQFMRVFADIKVQTGPDANGVISEKRVPVIYGQSSWQGSQILAGQTQNTLHPVPLMAASIVNLEPAPERRYNPTHESTAYGVEREFKDGAYTGEIGSKISVDRYMPVPYNMDLTLDVWTSNTSTKLQIMEQILSLFNPALQLQQNSNHFDWSSIFELELTDVTWTNRGQVMSVDEREIATLQFRIGIWINSPAKIKRQQLVHQIVTNISAVNNLSEADISNQLENPMSAIGERLSQVVVTPGNYRASIGMNSAYASDELVLLSSDGEYDETLSWKDLLDQYGYINPEVTRVRLKPTSNIEELDSDILGSLAYTDRANALKVTIDQDTLPAVTVGTVIKAIDPQQEYPGNGLDAPVTGDRYLVLAPNADTEVLATEEGLVNDTIGASNPGTIESAIADDHKYWGNFKAWENDIIEFDGTDWFIAFSATSSDVEIVYDSSYQSLLRFNGSWEFLYFGIYCPGYWRIENLADPDTPAEYISSCNK
jgi:hypothetical protein